MMVKAGLKNVHRFQHLAERPSTCDTSAGCARKIWTGEILHIEEMNARAARKERQEDPEKQHKESNSARECTLLPMPVKKDYSQKTIDLL